MDELHEFAGVCWLELSGLPRGIRAVVTTRLGGTSTGDYASLNLGLHVGDDDDRVIENRRRIFSALDLDPHRAVFMNQVHGTRIATVTADHHGQGLLAQDHALVATDAMVTQELHTPLVALSADCSPLLIASRDGRSLGVAHAGWRGTQASMAPHLVAALRAWGHEPDELHAVVGPTISLDAYEVGSEVVEALASATPGDDSQWLHRGATFHVDVARANQAQFLAAGLHEENVRITQDRSDDELFFSDRRVRPCGRMALIAWRSEA